MRFQCIELLKGTYDPARSSADFTVSRQSFSEPAYHVTDAGEGWVRIDHVETSKSVLVPHVHVSYALPYIEPPRAPRPVPTAPTPVPKTALKEVRK